MNRREEARVLASVILQEPNEVRLHHLQRLVAHYFRKRNNGGWYRSAVRIAIAELRDERGDRGRT